MTAGTSPVHGHRRRRSPCSDGDQVAAGRTLCTVESMKMHHDVVAERAGVVVGRRRVRRCRGRRRRRPGRDRRRDDRTATAATERTRGGRSVGGRRGRSSRTSPRSSNGIDSGSTSRVRTRSSGAADSAGAPPGRTSPTSSIAGSFVEYGPLVVAAQRRRRGVDDLVANTPADGMIGGIGTRQRRPVRRPGGTLRGGVVRLHRARRHPGNAQPPQEGPPVRAGRRAAPAGRAVHRRRWRTAGRLGGTGPDRAGLPGVPAHRRAVRARPARRRQLPGIASPATPHCSAAAMS